MNRTPVEGRREDEIPISPTPDSSVPEIFSGKKIFFLNSCSGSRRSEIPHIELEYCPRDEVSRRLFHSNSESCDCDCTSDGCWGCLRRNRKCFCRVFLLALSVAVIILLFGFLSYNLTGNKDEEEPSIVSLKADWVVHEHFYNSSDQDKQTDTTPGKNPVVDSPVPIFEALDDYDSNGGLHKHHYQVIEVGYGQEVEDIEPLSYSPLNAPHVDSRHPTLIINDGREPHRAKRSSRHQTSKYEVVVKELNDIEEEMESYLKNFDQKARTVFQPFSLTTPVHSTPMESDDEYSLEINDIEEELRSKFMSYVTDDGTNDLEDGEERLEGKSAGGEHRELNVLSELLGMTDMEGRNAGDKYNIPGSEDLMYTTERQQTIGVLFTTEGYRELKHQSTTGLPVEKIPDANSTEQGRAESVPQFVEGVDTSRTFSSLPLIQMALPIAGLFGLGQANDSPSTPERPDRVKGISLAEAKEQKKDKRKYLLLNSRVVGGSSDVKFPTGPDVSKPFVNAFETLKTNQQLSFTPSAASQYIVPYQMCFFASPKPPFHVAQPRTFPLNPLFPNLGDKNLGDKQPYPPPPQNFLSFSINNFANPPFRQGNQPTGGSFYNFPSQQHFPSFGTGPGSKQPVFCTYLQPPLFQFPTVSGTADFSHAKCDNCEDEPRTSSRERYVSSAWERLCSNDNISCRDGSSCIPIENWCDNQVHCKDASDESFCSCRERVARDRLCDGYLDCPQGEDEIGCFDCPKSAFSCDSAVSPQSCIPLSKRCDGVQDCSTGADESDCSALFFHMRQNDTYHVSQTSGFLHRNWKGDWFPVCVEIGDGSWATEACSGELGFSPQEVTMSFQPVPDHYKGPFIVRQEDGSVTLQDHCKGHVSTFVKCPTMKCGTRVQFPNLQEFESRFRRFVQNEVRGPLIKWWNSLDKTQAPVIEDRSNRTRDRREETGRVVGGRESEPRAWPWAIAIYKDGGFHCGGVILDEKWVLTAAHCMEQYWKHFYEVRGGMLRRFSFSAMEQIRTVTHIIIHENYNPTIMSNDIAVLRLDKPFHFNRWVRPACLPSLEEGVSKFLWGPVPGTTCIAVGWGALRERGSDPDQLREVEIPIMSRCKHKEDLAGAEICAGKAEGGKDTCQGDSGGPLLCRDSNTPSSWYVAGIVSHGEGCARPGEPGAYTRLSLFVDWITANTNDFLLPASRPLKSCPGLRCRSGNKLCIPAKWVCNGFTDCLEAEDERNCSSSFMLSEMYNRQALEKQKDDEKYVQKSDKELSSKMVGEGLRTTENYVEHTVTSSSVKWVESTTESSRFESTMVTTPGVEVQIKVTEVGFEEEEYETEGVMMEKSTKPMVVTQTTSESFSEEFETNEIPQVRTTTEGLEVRVEEGVRVQTQKIQEVMTEETTLKTEEETLRTEVPQTEKQIPETQQTTLQKIEMPTTVEVETEAPQPQTTEMLELKTQKSEEVQTTEGLKSEEEELEWVQTTETRSIEKLEQTLTTEGLQEMVQEQTTENFQTTDTIQQESEEMQTEVAWLPTIETPEAPQLETTEPSLQEVEEMQHLRTKIKVINVAEDQTIKTLPDESSSEETTEDYEQTGEVSIEGTTESPERSTAVETNESDEVSNSIESTTADEVLAGTTTVPFEDAKDYSITPTTSSEDNSSEEVTVETNYKLDEMNVDERIGEGTTEEVLRHTMEDLRTTEVLEAATESREEAGYTQSSETTTKHITTHSPHEPKTPVGHRRSKLDSEFFQCEDIVQSILASYRCDGMLDCEDGTDEINCTCADTLRYTNPKLLCDGRFDCADLSDERNCSKCSEDEFHCKLSRECIPSSERCNGKPKCRFGEDERKCFALSESGKFQTGKHILSTSGVLMTNKNGVWSAECQTDTPLGAESAIDICTDLGTTGYERYENRTLSPDCIGFHVTCSESLISSLHYYKAESGGYIWPWNAIVYSDGVPVCSAALLQPEWLLTSSNCVKNISLTRNYLTAKMGATTPPSKISEAYTKLIRINAIRNIQNSDMSLLHLSRRVNPTDYIRPIGIPYVFDSNPKKDVCITVAEDQTIFLKTIKDCPEPSRCYQKISPTSFNCDSDPWTGVVACQSRLGWYPASVFTEPLGHCGFSESRFTTVEEKLSSIYSAMDEDVEAFPELPCTGFRCPEGHCIPVEKMCDGFVDCSSGKDEDFKACSSRRKKRECGVGELKCRNGACISKVAFADGVDDCGDGSDEPANATCLEYLRLTAPQRICDGRRNCFDKTDEEMCSCGRGKFECKTSQRCLPRDFVCDGEKDCPNGEDENHCIGRKVIQKHHRNRLEIMQKSYGVWHSICLSDVPKDRADALCRDLGFSESLFTYEKNRTVVMPKVDSFSWVKLNPKTSIALRSDKPFVKLIKLKKTCTAVKCA